MDRGSGTGNDGSGENPGADARDPAIAVRDRKRFDATPGAGLAIDCLLAGIDAARPEAVVDRTVSVADSTLAVGRVVSDRRSYDLDAYDRVLVLGGGNAAGRLAAALEARLGDRIDGGIVVTDDPVALDRIEVVEGSHPYPDRAALAGTERLLELASDADSDDLVLGAITGGGSALLPAPAGEIGLEELRELTETLVRSGATIDEINAVRKHVSALKGGRLARAAAPATVAGLVLSDVVGDDPATIASGPFSPDPTTFAEALGVLERYDLAVPDSVRRRLESGAAGDVAETPGLDDPTFESVDVHVLASNATAIEAASAVAESAGFEPLVLSTRIRGEASEVGTVHAGVAEEVAASGRPIEPPAVLLSGGETTVTVGNAAGRGGPNQEFTLSCALACSAEGVVVASVDTDGLDGATDAAGALVSSDAIGGRDAAGEGGGIEAPDAQQSLDTHDVYPLLADADALLHTGPTGTNVNDLRVIVVPEEG